MGDFYFMSPPSTGWSLRGRANFRSREGEPVNAQRARQEWLRLARRIEALGGTVVALRPPSDALTGMPYAAECGHLVVHSGRPTFLLPRMASPHRQAEHPHWRQLAQTLGLAVIEPERGIWEAQGDVAEFEGVTVLFFGGRTTREGVEAIRPYFEGETLVVEIREPAFHGNMALCPLPAAGRLLLCPEVFSKESLSAIEGRFGQEKIVVVTEPEIRSYATNGLPIGRSVLAPSLVPDRVRLLLEGLGLEVERFSMTELCEKAGGASRCLVSYAKVESMVVPDEFRLERVALEIESEAT